jgi:hypothetical protein
MAVFVDRGKQMFSQKRLKAVGVNWLHIKYCTHHLAKSVCRKFGVGNAELNRLIYNLQNCQSIDHYIKTLIDTSTKFAVLPEHAESIENTVDRSIMLYLLAISPTNFSVVGNLNILDEELQLVNFIWGTAAVGDPMPMFGVNSTIGIDGENNAYLHNNIQHDVVINGVIAFMT